MTIRAGWPVALVVVLLSVGRVQALAPCESVAGKFAAVEGSVELMREAGDWHPGALDAVLCQGDTVRVGARSRAALMLVNDAVLRLDQNTTMRLVDIAADKSKRSLLDIAKGAFQSFSRKPRQITINTPYLNGSIEGTEFIFRVENETTQLTVFEGTVVAANEFGKMAVAGGGSVAAGKGQAPTPKVLLRPRDGSQWALYYPPIIPSISSAQHELNAASELLQVGRADEAAVQIDKVLQRDPQNAAALSLQTIILLVQNESAKALTVAQQAVQAAPESASANIALSYALQANFDLNGAKAALQKAVAVEPDNALAWARLAEIHASFGELEESHAAADRAVVLAPELSRTQSVLGFSHLMQVETSAAIVTFDKAIELDQADPLPRLGKGLALIREGDLTEGRREIEIGVGLDGNNALIRSYLGKAYFEEKRTDLATGQYAAAKALDPNDPTAYFYDAIAKQTTNQPVAALDDMQHAIELNDNRAVYRSRLLLDSDSAARGASLARIYSDLGFQQLALVEGWKSVNTDPSNYSAHRLLADSYASRPRSEIARVSELLQSQLLQPLNSTPIQPRLGESNLYLVSASGPSGLSFNEYNQLFSRDGATFQANGIVGSNSTGGEEVVASSVSGALAGSVGVSHFETDGWRDNAYQNDDLANVFVQYQLSPEASVQSEYRYRKSQRGDQSQVFFEEAANTGVDKDLETHALRLGGRYDFTPGSTLLTSVQASKRDDDTIEDYPDEVVHHVAVLVPEDTVSLEAQHLWRQSGFKLTSGAGYFDINGHIDLTIDLDFNPIGIPETEVITQQLPTDTQHTNVYSYANIDLLDNLQLTLGLSADLVSSEYFDEYKTNYNPKFGATWSPFDATTLRAAAFKARKRTLATNATLEPTQVAGFNQFFDDPNQSESENYGIAIDQKFTPTVIGGLEYAKRDLTDVPYLDPYSSESVFLSTQWEDATGRAYLFWTPQAWLALSAQFEYEKDERDEDLPEGFFELTTKRVPLEIKLFSETGWSAALRGTYITQEGDFSTSDGDVGYLHVPDEDSFLLLDALLSYRLPNRYGIVSVGASNLTDEEYHYFEKDLNNARIQPGRFVYARVTLTFP